MRKKQLYPLVWGKRAHPRDIITVKREPDKRRGKLNPAGKPNGCQKVRRLNPNR
jgi:hypothetical protein